MLLFSNKLLAMLEMHGGIKFNYDVHCEMFKILDGEIIDRDTRWVDSPLKTINNKTEIDTKIKQAMDHVREAIPELEAKNGSGWVFQQVLTINLNIARYKPIKGSSYMELPKSLKMKRAIVSVCIQCP